LPDWHTAVIDPRWQYRRHLDEPGAQHSDALVLQCETELNSTYPAPGAVANVADRLCACVEVCAVIKETAMVKLKDEDEIQTETWNPRSPAYQRRDNPDVLEDLRGDPREGRQRKPV